MNLMPNIRIGTVILLCIVGVVAAPGRASAQWSATPHVGAVFGGSVGEAPTIDYGVAVGWMGRLGGVEVDLSYAPGFFDAAEVPEQLVGESSVMTLMVNGLFGVPFGGDRWHPYVAAGVGLLRTDIGDDDSFIRGSANNVGINVGGGLIVTLTDRLRLRGDVRYVRDLQDIEGESEFFSLGSNKLDFWRASAGIGFRF